MFKSICTTFRRLLYWFSSSPVSLRIRAFWYTVVCTPTRFCINRLLAWLLNFQRKKLVKTPSEIIPISVIDHTDVYERGIMQQYKQMFATGDPANHALHNLVALSEQRINEERSDSATGTKRECIIEEHSDEEVDPDELQRSTTTLDELDPQEYSTTDESSDEDGSSGSFDLDDMRNSPPSIDRFYDVLQQEYKSDRYEIESNSSIDEEWTVPTQLYPIPSSATQKPLKSILKNSSNTSTEKTNRRTGSARPTVKFVGLSSDVEDSETVCVFTSIIVDDKAISGQMFDAGPSELLPLMHDIQALVNKATFNNLDIIQNELGRLFAHNSFHTCLCIMWNCILKQLLLQPIEVDEETLKSICINYAALVAVMHRSVDKRIGEFIAHRMCYLLHKDRTPFVRTLAAMLGALYGMLVVSDQVVLGYMVESINDDLVEINTLDALIYIVRNHRKDLRVDDEESMNDFVRNVSEHVNATDTESQLEDLSRVRHYWSELEELCGDRSQKNNWKHLRKELFKLTKLKAKKDHNVSLDYRLLRMPDERFNAELCSVMEQGQGGISLSTNHGNQYKLVAVKLQLRTPVRENIIRAVIESNDYIKAANNIEALKLGQRDCKQVIVVLVKMVLSEKHFNEFYPLLIGRLCKRGHDEYRRQLRLHIRSSIAQRDDRTISTNVLSKLISRLLQDDILDFRVLKSFKWCENANAGRLEFMRHIVIDLLKRKPIVFFKSTIPNQFIHVAHEHEEDELLWRFLQFLKLQMLEFKRTQECLEQLELLKLEHLVKKLEIHFNDQNKAEEISD